MRLRELSKAVVLLALAACWTAVGGCSTAPPGDLVRTYQRALEAFDQAAGPEDYLRCAVLYQEILDRGVVSGALLYNQGNAYMQAGQRGRAIACYRRALAYRPRDPQLRANLQLALDSDAAIQGPRGMLDYVFFWRDWISYPGKVRVAVWLAGGAFMFGILALFVPRRRVLHRAAWGAVVLTVIMASSAAYDWHRFEKIQRGVVIRAEVVARKGNGDSYDPAFTEPLKEGVEFRVIERRGGWLHIQLDGGQTAWAPDAAVTTY